MFIFSAQSWTYGFLLERNQSRAWTFDNGNPATRSHEDINIAGLPCTPALSLAINVAGVAAVAPMIWQEIRSRLWRQAFIALQGGYESL